MKYLDSKFSFVLLSVFLALNSGCQTQLASVGIDDNKEQMVRVDNVKLIYETVDLNQINRQLITKTPEGYFLVQDFYQTGQKRTSPFLLKDWSTFEISSAYEKLPIEGKIRVFNPDGSNQYEMNFENGVLNGPTLVWHKNGQLAQELPYKLGVLDGVVSMWYENGQLNSSIVWINDQMNGPTKFWYENGQLFSEGNIKNNKMEGKNTSWHPNGQKSIEAYFKNDRPTGTWLTWYPNGQLRGKVVFNKQGKRIYQVKYKKK